MKNIAFIFPGQGSQSVGMGRSLHDACPEARSVFEEAGDVLGYDLAKLCSEGPVEDLNRTEMTQPALLTCSVAALRVFEKEFDFSPAFVAGHSLGEYTALVSNGSLEFSAAVSLVRLRGRFMQECVPEGAGSMSALIGLDDEAAEKVCKESSRDGEPVVPANLNSPGQVVISGDAEAVKRAGALAKEYGAKRVLPLAVSVPSHSPLMAEAAENLDMELKNTTFKDFSVPLVTNVEATALEGPAKIGGLLKLQLVSPVRWVEIVRFLKARGVTTMIEIGPGRVLSGLVKRIERVIKTLNFGEAEDLSKVEEALEEALKGEKA